MPRGTSFGFVTIVGLSLDFVGAPQCHAFGGRVGRGTQFRVNVSERGAVATRSRRNWRDDPIATAPGSDTALDPA